MIILLFILSAVITISYTIGYQKGGNEGYINGYQDATDFAVKEIDKLSKKSSKLVREALSPLSLRVKPKGDDKNV